MFEDRHVIVTGGSSGAGRELARRALASGARVTLVARNAGRLAEARDALATETGRDEIGIESCDVSDADAVEASFEAIAERAGPVDMLVNSAGILTEGPFETQPLEAYRSIMAINFFGALQCSRAVLPQLEARGGRVVHVASVAGLMGVYGYGPYCAAKHALIGLAECMRQELRPRGVAVHVVCPPEFESPMVDELERHRSACNREIVRAAGVLSIDEVVDETIRGVEAGRFMIVPGRKARLAVGAARVAPGIARAVVDRRISAETARERAAVRPRSPRG